MLGNLTVGASLGLVVLAAVIPSTRGRTESVLGWVGTVLILVVILGVLHWALS